MISPDTAQRRTTTPIDEARAGNPRDKPAAQGLLVREADIDSTSPGIETPENAPSEAPVGHAEPFFDFGTQAMLTVAQTIQRAAKTDACVLIVGEHGTGKNIAAKSLHESSHLAGRPFVTVSCRSLSQELLESTLFGHVGGAFVGAACDRWGKVREASGGTLFLDDVGDLPMDMQPKVLRLLQDGEYERVGEAVTRHAGVRVVAATNHDLKKQIGEGTFREDLYYRLSVITLRMPALRDRGADLMGLAAFYLEHFARLYGRPAQGFVEDAERAIRSHAWPGNLRELRNAIECAVVMNTGNLISLSSLPSDVQRVGADGDGPGGAPAPDAGSLISMKRLQEIHISRIVERTANIAVAAEVLGLNPATLYRRRKRLGIR